mmetsp:Transcript_27932/g.41236  ORF Transcript_27932/g.41236 Transcript_27932/m.41236 type:complete len:357 (-) Transcript_27932:680-1750(-)|eukprot:CAMPEP_0194204062 /NCGR_PEP_ID=MMETSP0156-20130528/3687_1 /TAXON_ID=33649 /ORGANISM="Thalassionema nitzschioides, Strain L26-B" /LENGTH=356 /DNA_ID=CAMNT_0038929977 /DNA_START=34 /DNA_END=1104 /DNA_ORIENTATION=+
MTKQPTRLIIQGVVALEVLLLVAYGVWFGLCHQGDQLCVPFLPHTGRQILMNSPTPKTKKRNQNQKYHRFQVKLTLRLESGLSWEIWSKALNNWFEATDFHRWPLWKAKPISDVSVGGQLTSKLKKQMDMNVVKTKYILDEVSRMKSKPQKEIFDITIYIPHASTFRVADKSGVTSSALTMNDNCLFITVQDLESPNQAISDAMSHLAPFLITHGISSSNNANHTPADIHLWLEKVFMAYKNEAELKLSTIHDKLLAKEADTLVTTEIGEKWIGAKLLIKDSQTLKEDNKLLKAVQALESAISEIESIRVSQLLMKPLDFPTDHRLAIFAPLLFPLLIPMTAGFVREYKRLKGNGK